MVQDDHEWDEALAEAARTSRSGAQLRELYVTIMQFCQPSDPRQLFLTHWASWTDDFRRRLGWLEIEELSDHQMVVLRTLVLKDLETRLQSWEVSLSEYQLPVPTVEEVAVAQQQGGNLHMPTIIREELDFNFSQVKNHCQTKKILLKKIFKYFFNKHKQIMPTADCGSGGGASEPDDEPATRDLRQGDEAHRLQRSRPHLHRREGRLREDVHPGDAAGRCEDQ